MYPRTCPKNYELFILEHAHHILWYPLVRILEPYWDLEERLSG